MYCGRSEDVEGAGGGLVCAVMLWIRRDVGLRMRTLATASMIVIVAPLVAVRSFARLARWLGAGASGLPARRVPLDDAALARWVDRVLHALRGPWHHTCLRRATVLYGLLR